VISYAQNAEDVVLARVFRGQDAGRYVDVGAGYPVEDSVTKHFYDLGWRGINLEPVPSLAEELSRARPEDVNLVVAVGAKPGNAALHVVLGQWGRSTLDDGIARTYREDHDWQVRDVEVEVVTLAEVLDAHPGAVDFLKIDVEGAERDVIEGGGLDPAPAPGCRGRGHRTGLACPSHGAWEPILVDSGYHCALFDGLNRFYARADDDDALTRLAAPANVFDEYDRYEATRQRTELESLQANRSAELGYIRRLEEAVREAQQAGTTRDEYVRLESILAETQRDAARGQRYSAALESRVSELEALLDHAHRNA
jgi:FkbM family methyltransferase